MRILIIGKMFPLSKMARALQLAKVARALANAGCEIMVIAGLDADAEMPQWPFPVHYIKSEVATPNPARGPALKRFIISLHNFFKRRGWWRRSSADGTKIVREFNPDIILSFSSPYDSHCVALELQRKTGIPWIAYFSDPWPPLIMPVPYRELPRGRGRLKTLWEIRFVRKTLRKCDALVMGNFYALEMMEKEIGIAVIGKGFAIPHIGSEKSGWGEAIDKKLAHIGELCDRRNSPELLAAVKRVAAEMPDRFQGLVLVGEVCETFRDLIRREEMEDMVECVGHVPEARAQEIASRSGALLVIEANMGVSPFLPSKFADYAMTGRPIVAITPAAGAIRDYLKKHGGGWAATHNVDQIADAIRQAFQAKNDGQPESSLIAQSTLSSPFRSESVARLYMNMFESVLRRMQAKEQE